MYTLVSAIGEPLGGGNRWRDVAIGDLAVNQIFSSYARVIATLTNPFLPAPVALELKDIEVRYGSRTDTFNQMLASLGNEALPTSTTLPVLHTRYAKYADGFHAGYKIQPVHPSWAADAEVPPSEKTWLHLTRPNTDYALFARSCLVSVNGLYHQLDHDTTGVYVQDGDRSRQHCGHNQLGIYSFRDLGALTYVPITPEMVYKQTPAQQLRHRAYLNVGVDLSDKTVMVVIGGYLHVLDSKTLFRTGDRSVGINFEAIPLFERFYESRKLLDLSALQLETTTANPDQVGVEDLLSDAVLTRYLTLSQSFIVLLDNAEVFVERTPLRTTRTPGVFIGYEQPVFPLITGYGLQPNYWCTFEDTQWSVHVVDGLVDNPLYHTVTLKSQRSVSDQRDPQQRTRFSQAQFLRIGRDL